MRERLALENDLERRAWKAKTTSAIANSVSCVIASVRGALVGAGRYVARNWGRVAVVIVVIAAVFGFSVWRNAEHKAVEDRY